MVGDFPFESKHQNQFSGEAGAAATFTWVWFYYIRGFSYLDISYWAGKSNWFVQTVLLYLRSCVCYIYLLVSLPYLCILFFLLCLSLEYIAQRGPEQWFYGPILQQEFKLHLFFMIKTRGFCALNWAEQNVIVPSIISNSLLLENRMKYMLSDRENKQTQLVLYRKTNRMNSLP